MSSVWLRRRRRCWYDGRQLFCCCCCSVRWWYYSPFSVYSQHVHSLTQHVERFAQTAKRAEFMDDNYNGRRTRDSKSGFINITESANDYIFVPVYMCDCVILAALCRCFVRSSVLLWDIDGRLGHATVPHFCVPYLFRPRVYKWEAHGHRRPFTY